MIAWLLDSSQYSKFACLSSRSLPFSKVENKRKPLIYNISNKNKTKISTERIRCPWRWNVSGTNQIFQTLVCYHNKLYHVATIKNIDFISCLLQPYHSKFIIKMMLNIHNFSKILKTLLILVHSNMNQTLWPLENFVLVAKTLPFLRHQNDQHGSCVQKTFFFSFSTRTFLVSTGRFRCQSFCSLHM